MAYGQGRHTALRIALSSTDAETLRAWQRKTTIHAGVHRRARAILLVAGGHSITEVAFLTGMARNHVMKWCYRYLAHGLDGLRDQPRHGRPGGRRVKETP